MKRFRVIETMSISTLLALILIAPSPSLVRAYTVNTKRSTSIGTSSSTGTSISTTTSLFGSSYSKRAPMRDTSNEEEQEQESYSRRNFLLLTSAAALGVGAANSNSNDGLFPLLTSINAKTATANTNTNTNTMNIAQAVQWIDDNCDRRYLHAVIASDYRFLYRGVPGLRTNQIKMERLTPDLLIEGTYGEDADALVFFQNLQEVMKDEVVNPSNGHLSTSSVNDAAEWGTAGSIWPVNGAHYAWFQDQQLFYPRPNSSISISLSRNDLIVDGKDCGKESLEDALRAESCEVMVASGEFLVVPAALDEALRDALGSSFLV